MFVDQKSLEISLANPAGQAGRCEMIRQHLINPGKLSWFSRPPGTKGNSPGTTFLLDLCLHGLELLSGATSLVLKEQCWLSEKPVELTEKRTNFPRLN